MLFKQIHGKNQVKEELIGMVDHNRLPHALLFLGKEGSGHLSLALATTQYILCENPQDEDACGQCPSCLKNSQMVHPDVHFVYPTVGPKAISDHFIETWRKELEKNAYLNVFQWLQSIDAGNKQGNITKEECVQIVKKLSLKTFEGKHKVLIIWMAEYLGKEGNRLLKTIEEPPDDTVIILLAENEDKVLNTILSRCQMIKIKSMTDDEIKAGLIEKYGISATEAQSIAYLSNGNFNDALNFVEMRQNEEQQTPNNDFVIWLRKCFIGNGPELVKWVLEFAGRGRENQKMFLQYAQHFLREYLRIKMISDENVRLLPNDYKVAKKMTSVLEFDQVERISQLFTDCEYYVERNANPRILFLDASIQLHRIFKNQKQVS